jgi:hypothetical protein
MPGIARSRLALIGIILCLILGIVLVIFPDMLPSIVAYVLITGSLLMLGVYLVWWITHRW